jgi:DNA-nicking Smr family endonuclease
VKKQHGKGGRKEPESHDEELWQHTAATIEPLKRGKPRVHSSAVAAPESLKSNVSLKRESPGKSPPARGQIIEPPKAVRDDALKRQPPGLSAFDRNSARKIRIGRIEIEARIDLHGLRQAEAHAALRSFLFRCQSHGLRYVLVITGKGKMANSRELAYNDESERGVLKRNVPRWLEESDVRNIVVSYTTAAIQHGGEGAIYVHLRSKNRV